MKYTQGTTLGLPLDICPIPCISTAPARSQRLRGQLISLTEGRSSSTPENKQYLFSHKDLYHGSQQRRTENP